MLRVLPIYCLAPRKKDGFTIKRWESDERYDYIISIKSVIARGDSLPS